MSSNTKPLNVIDWLKPRRAEAITRLRNNGFAFTITLVVAQLLPLFPSPLALALFLMNGGKDMGIVTRIACWLELAVLAVLTLNILQASYALQYPPPAHAPLESPAKRVQQQQQRQQATPAPRRPKPITPQSSLQRGNDSLSTAYAPSPFSTPSRVLNYAGPSPSPGAPFTPSGSIASASLGLSSPLGMSSPLAYRGRHPPPAGRPVDGNLLSRLQAAADDD